MYCMDFLQLIRLHNESVQMIRDTQTQTLQTIERINERMFRAIEHEHRRVGGRTTTDRINTLRYARDEHERRRQRTRTPPQTRPQTRRTTRQPTQQTAPPTMSDSLSSLASLVSLASNFQNGLSTTTREPVRTSNGTSRGDIQYYIIPLNTTGGIWNTLQPSMESVPIRVSEDVISRACRVYTYEEEQDSSGNSGNSSRTTECPIDLTPFQPGEAIMEIRQCGHRFRASNLRRWFETNPRCPLCRVDVRDVVDEDISGTSSTSSNSVDTVDVSNIANTTTASDETSAASDFRSFPAPTHDTPSATSTSPPSTRDYGTLLDSSSNHLASPTLETVLERTLDQLLYSTFDEMRRNI